MLFVCVALLVSVDVARGEGIYQRTRNGKTLVWNNHPKPGDEATWSGARDRERHARGFGTLSWYTKETGSAKPPLYARYWGRMVDGKLEGPVNAHTGRRTAHAYFAGPCGIDVSIRGRQRISLQRDLEHSCGSCASLTQLKRVHYPWLAFLPELDAVDVPREGLYRVATG